LRVIERFILFKVIYNLAMRPANRHGVADFDFDKNGDGYPMPQIDVTERRITTALDRIRKSIEREPVPQMANAVAHELESKVSQLQSNLQEANAELAEEQSTNAQLEQRVRRLRERQQGFLTKLEADIGKQQSAMRKLDEDLQKLRLANEQLRQSNHALRTANETGVADAELINKAMMEEIVSLHAARSADQAEAQVVITSLNVLLQKTASNGAGFEESL
jgi:chromosome segregation ATPase